MANSLLLLLDDIAAVLDDVAVMSKVAAKKTAGVLGDDLALNAEKVMGVRADRELPVVWAVAKGSFQNKLILVPAALAISAFLPWLITPLLMLGGAFLCFEGFEKVFHKWLHGSDAIAAEHEATRQAIANQQIDMVAFEQKKIQGAIRTDFILSAEIIVITLGTVVNAPFMTQVAVVSAIAIVMTVGVYALVAGIVRLDDAGLYLTQQESPWQQRVGHAIVAFAPYLMKILSFVGTLAMFLVGGGILLHGIPNAHDVIHAIEHSLAHLPTIGGVLAALAPTILNGLFGLIAGGLIVALFTLYQRLRGQHQAH